jgi:hypothetical protein
MLNGWAYRIFFLSMLNGWAILPGQGVKGGCLPYALAYCATHSGSQLIIITTPHRSGSLSAHALARTKDGRYTDNMHPVTGAATNRTPTEWADGDGVWTVFRVIDFDHRNRRRQARHRSLEKNGEIGETKEVKCPHCGQNIPDKKVREYIMSLQGKSGKGKAKARDPEKMRQAALKRWGKI